MKKNPLKDKKVVVMGLGRFGGGLDAAVFAVKSGASDVLVTDTAGADELAGSLLKLSEFEDIRFRLGGHAREDFINSDVVIVNPAVSPENDFLMYASASGSTITSQVELFFTLCPCRIIAVTGSNGKSTTTSLIAHLLREAMKYQDGLEYDRVLLGGNIGNHPLLSELEALKPNDIAVLEISSFQAEQLICGANQVGPYACVITNLSPNHLDRHGTFERYCAAKESLFYLQECNIKRPVLSVFNLGDNITAGWYEKYQEPGRKCLGFSAVLAEEYRDITPLPGRMNLENLAAAVCVVKQFGVGEETIRAALPAFQALKHRLELVRELDGVRWYNDSIATTPESVMAAIEAFDEPMVLIAGGYDKGMPFDELGRVAAAKIRGAVLLGKTREKIKGAIEAGLSSLPEREELPAVKLVDTLEEAVEAAREMASAGDVVVMSPACASYDMFTNFQHRGEEFCRLVGEL